MRGVKTVRMERQLEPELMDLPEEARAYARAKFAHVNEAFVARLLELAGDKQNIKSLDVGTGPASIPILVAKARPTWHITAVEYAKAMVMIAQIGIKMSGLTERVKILQADAKATNLPDGAFDLIFCNSLLHHMPDPIPLWQEIKRLAAPGAVIFLRDLRRPESEEKARELVNMHASTEPPLLQEEFYRSLLAAFRPDEVREQLSTAGLASLQVQPVPDRYLDVFGLLK